VSEGVAQYEIERKFLLNALPRMPEPVDVLEIDQGYLPGVRFVERLRRQRDRGGNMKHYRTVKIGVGVQRMELEEETDPKTFEHLWLLTDGRRLRKRRYIIPEGDRYWEVDEFLDRDLVLAEMEIPTVDTEITVPEWLRPVLVRDVTGERKYTNRSLAR
jgi:CYTH domain-containing protein